MPLYPEDPASVAYSQEPRSLRIPAEPIPAGQSIGVGVPFIPARLDGINGVEVKSSGRQYTIGLDIASLPIAPGLPPQQWLAAWVEGMPVDAITRVAVNAIPADAPADGVTYGRKNHDWVDVTTSLTIDWGSITGKPATFPPDAHTHPMEDIIGLNTEITRIDDANAAQDTAIAALETESASHITDAPADGQAYNRKDSAWEVADTTGPGLVEIDDSAPFAPIEKSFWWESDTGYLFLRVPNGGSPTWVQVNGIGDAPVDGTAYNRRNGAWVAAATGGASDWADITGKPTTFPPAAHNHPISEVTSLQSTLDGKVTDLPGGITTHWLRTNGLWAEWTTVINWSTLPGKPSTFAPDPEAIDDRVAALLVAGANITLTYNDVGNSLTIAAAGGGGGITEPTTGSSLRTTGGAWELGVKQAGDTMTGPLQVPLGSQAAPAVQFNTPLAGFYSLGVANITAVANNVLAFDFGSTFNYSRVPLRVPTGSASATGLHFGTAGTGIFGSGSAVQLSVSGVTRFASTAAENTSTVPITLPADPTTALQAATKQYADTKLAASAASAYGLTLIDDADAAAARTTLGVGSMATRNVTISTSDPSGGADGDVWFKV